MRHALGSLQRVPVAVYVQVYKVVVDFGDVDVSKLVSGQYINFEAKLLV